MDGSRIGPRNGAPFGQSPTRWSPFNPNGRNESHQQDVPMGGVTPPRQWSPLRPSSSNGRPREAPQQRDPRLGNGGNGRMGGGTPPRPRSSSSMQSVIYHPDYPDVTMEDAPPYTSPPER